MTTNLQIVLTDTPNGKLQESHFESRSSEAPSPEDGQVLVRSVLLSLDAANRAWMQGATYKSAVEPGQIMHGYALGEVIESRSATHATGDIVAGELGWQQYAALDASAVRPVGDHRPLSHYHSLLGIAGITAYHGLLTLFGVREGETLLVLIGLGCYLGTCAILRRPLSWAWALVPGLCLSWAIEAWEIHDHWSASGRSIRGQVPGILGRHLRDVLVMNLPAAAVSATALWLERTHLR